LTALLIVASKSLSFGRFSRRKTGEKRVVNTFLDQSNLYHQHWLDPTFTAQEKAEN